mgnify:CR=1 FL=1
MEFDAGFRIVHFEAFVRRIITYNLSHIHVLQRFEILPNWLFAEELNRWETYMKIWKCLPIFRSATKFRHARRRVETAERERSVDSVVG